MLKTLKLARLVAGLRKDSCVRTREGSFAGCLLVISEEATWKGVRRS
jgi:hypothetical protein